MRTGKRDLSGQYWKALAATLKRMRWGRLAYAVASVAVLALILPAPFAGSRMLLAGAGSHSPWSLVDARSPGARSPGALFQTKPDRRTLPVVPEQRVLSQVREHPPVVPAPVAEPPVLADAFPDPVTPTLLANPVGPQAFTLPSDFPTLPGTVLPPAASSLATPPVNTVPAVPEPSSWTTMVLGFGLLGWCVRRERRRRARGSAG